MSGCECKPDAERKRARSVSAIARNIKRSAQPQGKAQPSIAGGPTLNKEVLDVATGVDIPCDFGFGLFFVL
jgi:hypothetical protein